MASLSTVAMSFIWSRSTYRNMLVAYDLVGKDGDVITSGKNTVSWQDAATGFKNSNWRQLVREGRPATTVLTGSHRRVELYPGELGGGWFSADLPNHTDQTYGENVWRGVYPTSVLFGGDPSNISDNIAEQSALRAFWSSCASARRSLQTGTFIGELTETIGMVRKSGKRLMDVCTKWNQHLRKRRRHARTRQDRRKAAADAWLEFRFGWNPLASDINGALDVWSAPRREARRITASGFSESNKVVTASSETAMGPILARDTTTLADHCDVRYKGMLMAQVPGVGGVVERLGLLPEDFLPTVYNLLPWSFLLDYVSNVGDAIEALSFPMSLLGWAQRTVRKSKHRKQMRVYSRPSESQLQVRNTVFTRTKPMGYKSWQTTVSRTPVNPSDIRTPSLVIKVPGNGQWVNIGALLTASKFRF